jgi:hypothetical protein
MSEPSDLKGPLGPLPVRLVERDGQLARFETDAETWDQLHAAGLFHTGGTQLERPFEPDRPVTIEALLDPSTDPRDEGDVEGWWAISVTQAVDLPADLADEGELREGISFRPPPWSNLQSAFEAMSAEPLLDLVLDVFEEEGWEVERPQPDTTILKVTVPPEVADAQLWVRTDEVLELVTVFAVLPAEVGRDRVGDMLELAARLNAEVPVGSYEADPQTGLLSFKTGIDVEGDRLSEALVRQMVRTALHAAERAQPAVAGVLAEGASPADVVADL